MAERYTGAEMNSDEIGRQMDAALAKYAAVEPRAGLEERILANVRAARANTPGLAWWKWALVAAVISVAGLWMLETVHRPATAKRISGETEGVASSQSPTGTPKRAMTSEARAESPEAHRAARRKVAQASQARIEADAKSDVFLSPEPAGADVFPSREQASGDVFPSPQTVSVNAFPAPRPLSEEEVALEQYVRDFPGDAKLVAQAQAATANEIVQNMRALEKESTESN